MIADAPDGDIGRNAGPPSCNAAAGAMSAVDAILPVTFEDRMLGHDLAEIEDAEQIGELLA
jgi:hypothetical protein